MAPETHAIDAVLWDALEALRNFITETTGEPPTSEEMANAIKRYFVLKEIKDHIEMERESTL